MAKPTPLELLLKHSKNISIFKDVGHKDICLLMSNTVLRATNKNDLVAEENSPFIDVNVILYGSFEISMMDEKIGELNTDDVFGLGSIMSDRQSYVSQTTIKATSHKGLVLTLKFSPFFLEPCTVSAKLHRNIAHYLAKTLSLEHKEFSKNKINKKENNE